MTCAAPALAEADAPSVWYRASETCPKGPQFLDKLAENARHARLAQAGDHIDFVVTLVADGNETVGRLERQTNSGIVAIRELRDATCEQVADALALSLGLALTPGQSNAPPLTPKPADSPETTAEATPSESAAEPPSATASTGTATAMSASSGEAPTPVPTPPQPGAEWSLGIELGATIGITTHPLPRGQLFVDFKPALSHFLPHLSVRGGVVGSTGSSETAVGPVQRWILAARAEACPVAWIAGRFDFRPCAGFELGADNASAEGGTGLNDHGLWAAPGAQLRLAFALQPKLLFLEASGGALIPLIRKEIFSGSQSLYRDAPVIFHAGLGVSLLLP